jgi:hypothetical protein
MMVTVMAVVYYYHNLCLCRIGCRETEDKRESKQNSFHSLVCRSAVLFTELL